MVEDGVASIDDIDTAMKLGFNHPMGPFELADHVGLDVRIKVLETLKTELNRPDFRPPQTLRNLVKTGKLGRKSGCGFKKWK